MRKLLGAILRDDRYRDVGLLVVRVGLGGSMMFHGYPKVMGGPEKWAKLGTAVQALGIDFAPVFWGGAAAAAETLGGLLLMIGLGTRFAATALAITMAVAAADHVVDGQPFATGWSHAFEDGVVFLALAIAGGGRFALERR
jgi:putative oxidoreductase